MKGNNLWKLTRFEIYKLISTRSFYICLGILFALVGVTAFTSEMMIDQLGDMAELTDSYKNMSTLTCFMTALTSGSISLMLGIFVPIFACEDYNIGTIRNILSRGYSRFEVYTSKFIAVLAATFAMIIVCCFAGLVFGAVLFTSGDVSFGGQQFKTLIVQMIVVIAYACVFYAISVMLQKTGTSIAFCIAMPMVLVILLRLGDTALIDQNISLSRYWLDGIATSISSVTVENSKLLSAFLCSVAYIAASLVGGWFGSVSNEY